MEGRDGKRGFGICVSLVVCIYSTRSKVPPSIQSTIRHDIIAEKLSNFVP